MNVETSIERRYRQMPLIPYDSFRNLEHWRRDIDRMFSHLPTLFSSEVERLGVPRLDVYETESEVVATCDIPGLARKEDVHIDVEDNVLTISGTIQRMNEIKEEHYHRQERFMGRFHRSVTLPARVSPEGVQATYKNGVLEVRMPKQKPGTKRKIDVDFH
jgi:HSP20 family protein